MKRMVVLFLCLLVLACAHTRSISDVHSGMTKAEVTQAWGGIYLITHRIYQGREVDVWDYNFWNGSGVRVYFNKDRVVATFYRPPGTYWGS
jgi:hypothetical protein